MVFRKIFTSAVIGGFFFFAKGFSQGRFSGYLFGDYYYNFSRDAATLSNVASSAGGTAYQAFQIRRIYFTYDNEISQTFSARFRLEADQSANASNGAIGVMVKDAYIRWKNIFSGSDFYFGIQPTPAYEISEAVWGYRSLEKTIMDLRSIVSSRDMGVSLRGSILENGMLSYWVLIGNNASNKPENDKYKRLYVNVQTKPTDEILATAYVDYGGRAKKNNPYTLTTVRNDLTTYALFVGYTKKNVFSVGAEIFLQSIAHEYNNGSALVAKDAEGISLFGSVTLSDEMVAVARYDSFDPNTAGSSKGDSRNYVLAGVSWKPDKNFSITPNMIVESYEKLSNGATPKTALTGRVTFYYIFL